MVTENFIQRHLRIKVVRIKLRNPKRRKQKKTKGRMPFIVAFFKARNSSHISAMLCMKTRIFTFHFSCPFAFPAGMICQAQVK